MLTLAEAPEGSKVIVEDIMWGGWGFRRRLMEMGIAPGVLIEVLNNSRGPVVVRVRGVTLAIGRGMASKVAVRIAHG